MTTRSIRLKQVRPSRPKSAIGAVVALLVLLGILLFVSVMTTIILAVGIWPGELKLTAPLMCSDQQPDAYVVYDTYQVQPGETSTTFTLYCMGPRGDFTDVGFFGPAALLTALHALIIVVVLVALFAWRVVVRRSRRSPGDDPARDSDRPASPGAGIPERETPVTARADDETEFLPPGPIIQE